MYEILGFRHTRVLPGLTSDCRQMQLGYKIRTGDHSNDDGKQA